MNENFNRENRYLVFKRSDMSKYLSAAEIECLEEIACRIAECRVIDGKDPLETVVVEKDWPQYDLVWKSIEAMAGGTA